MTGNTLSLGGAIDRIIEALRSFEAKDQQAILHTVCLHLSIKEPVVSPPAQPKENALNPSHEERSAVVRRNAPTVQDIRTLKEQKQPNSARQMACLVALYLQEYVDEGEKKDSITTADLEKYFKQASFKLPTKLEQLLIDCKKSGYFETPKRGEYKLTRVGYNLVMHSMPSKQSN